MFASGGAPVGNVKHKKHSQATVLVVSDPVLLSRFINFFKEEGSDVDYQKKTG